MKKLLFRIMFLGTVTITSFLMVNKADAQQQRGSSETTSQTDECYSGYRYKCEGIGTMCEVTSWICSTKPGSVSDTIGTGI
ncbi:hypothetical protein H7F37_13585 [Winogradskyella sp. PAMC22761]|nr:hypothetical protein H7F37_13585 [Winogradskyella sp. PAMC22761]